MKKIDDPLFKATAKLVVEKQDARSSIIQLKFMIGYNRTGRILDQLEEVGIVSERKGIYPRDVLIDDMQTLNILFEKIEMCEQKDF